MFQYNNAITIFLAYKTVLHSYGLDSNPSSDGDDNSDLEVMDVSHLNVKLKKFLIFIFFFFLFLW